MTTLAECASLIRSKNAGPFVITFDIMFETEETYLSVKRSGVITSRLIAERYNIPEQKVRLFFCDQAFAIKASIPRPVGQGDIGDADGHAGQQYIPLMGIEVPV